MRTNRAKRRQATNTFAQIAAEKERAEIAAAIKAGTLAPVDRSKIVSRSAIPQAPDYYRETWFTCKECGERELWTARQQKRWYEEQGARSKQLQFDAERAGARSASDALRREKST